ncbi:MULTISPECIES: alpha-amylase family glycosyl hydrolase [Sorangium]|uniref:alpha-amylase n=1 Tax=Sorangium cellulosum TaxID=56 RepID=A0A4P2R385_SORCE|nr:MULTISPECIES: alpha-amylase family glycosyl hydrolase [Sorangium]AUX37041.1 alpha-amylase [Sorangium cellulosum]WCQ96334.1 Beta/alpha-amylase [Sorangium sp. Soce836]
MQSLPSTAEAALAPAAARPELPGEAAAASSRGAALCRAAGAVLLALPAAGCMQRDDGLAQQAALAQEAALAAHVSDWREEIIYQVLIDRFADGDASNNYRVSSGLGSWHGGDWKGLEDRLPYLEELGVTALWISPIVKNVETDAGFDGYHGYWTQDFTALNPHFGDLASLRRLVASAHGRGMKVILDIVTNHVGQLFFYDINQNGQPDDAVYGGRKGAHPQSEYDPDFDPRGVQARTWLGASGPAPIVFRHDPATNHLPPKPELFQSPEVYNRKGRAFDFDDVDQLVHGDFPGGLKDIDTARCDVKRTMVDVFVRWVELTDVDGFRIDTVKHVEHEFWRYFAQNVRLRLKEKGKTNFFMFGEVLDGRDDLIGSFTRHDVPAHPHDAALGGDLERENASEAEGGCPGAAPITGDSLDGVFYFSQYYQAFRDVFRDAQGTRRIEELWAAREANYGTEPNANGTGLPPVKTLVNFIDNHDVPRFLYDGPGVSPFKADPEAALRNALLFLFTEDGIPCLYYGTEQGFSGGGDPANREDLWASGYDTQHPLFQWVKRLTALRRGYRALTVGEQRVRWSTERTSDEDEDAGIFAFERGEPDGDYALVVLNTHPAKRSATRFAGPVMTTELRPGTVLVDVLSPGKTTYTVGANGAVTVELPPVSGALLIPEDQIIQGL